MQITSPRPLYRCSMTSLSSGGCWRVAPCPEEMARAPSHPSGGGSRQTKHFRSRGEAKTAQKSMHLPPPRPLSMLDNIVERRGMLRGVPLPGRNGKGTLQPARRRRRADGGVRTAPNEGRQQGDDTVKMAKGARTSKGSDAAMVASTIRRLRRPKGGYGRHGDGDYFFDVLDVLKRRTVGCSFGRSLCVAGRCVASREEGEGE